MSKNYYIYKTISGTTRMRFQGRISENEAGIYFRGLQFIGPQVAALSPLKSLSLLYVCVARQSSIISSIREDSLIHGDFEIVQDVADLRQFKIPLHSFTEDSFEQQELNLGLRNENN